MLSFIVRCNQFLWNGPVLILLCSCHIYFTIRSRFVQRYLPSAFRTLFRENKASAFRALTTTLAATLGTGNIIGMSTAVALGGPGAVFWCWMVGIFGMATTYVECNLSLGHAGQPGADRGPMYLLDKIAGKRFVASLFALALLLGSTLANALTQSNALTGSVRALCSAHTSLLDTSPASSSFPSICIGLITAALVSLVIFGKMLGLREVCSILVPAMSLFFLIGIVGLLLGNLTTVPRAITTIVQGAFGLSELTGGFLGYTLGSAVRQGVAKGLFTNEAGLGTAPLAALTNSNTTPVEQSLVSMSATFFDTVFLCGITGIALVSHMLATPASYLGLAPEGYLTVAFSSLPFFGDTMLHLSIITFAFATLLGWSLFGEKAAAYLAGSSGITCYRFGYLIAIVVGSCIRTDLVWEWTDFANTFLLFPNLYLLFFLRKQVTYPQNKPKH